MNSQPRAGFATSRWSTITRVWTAGEPAHGAALVELGQRFRYPVYAYLRAADHAPSEAAARCDFFLKTLETAARRTDAAPREAQFRRFLVEQLDAWAASQSASKPDADLAVSDALLEARYRREAREGDAPTRAFERAFALEVLARACGKLETEAKETGHAEMYVALVPWLGYDPPGAEVESIAAALKSRPLTVLVALKRLRQRLRELASAELADTVVSEEDFVSEQHALFAVLRAEG